jgi:hypothetical protein
MNTSRCFMCGHSKGGACLLTNTTACPTPAGPVAIVGSNETLSPATRAVPIAVGAVHCDDWPNIVKRIAKRKVSSDRGVGDTLERLFSYVGGRQFKRVMEMLSVECGCGDRQTWLNDAYPYPPVWQPTVEAIPKPTSDRLVITIAVGEKYSRILDLARPLMEAYAKKCNADFVALTNQTQRWWGLEKFRVKAFQQHYDRVMFVDADVLIKPETPDLFKIVDPQRIGMHNDNPYNPGGTSMDVGNEGWLNAERAGLLNSQGVYLDAYDEPVCQNSGVVVCSKHHDIWNGMTKPFPMKHCDEQFWIEYQAQKYPIQQLSYRFNNQYWFGERFHKQCPRSHIIHFAGCAGLDRLALMEKELSLWNA